MGNMKKSAAEWPDRERVSLFVLVAERKAARASWPPGHEHGPKDGFTCDSCAHAPCCALAFDAYNTDGDCLADK